MMKLNEHLIAKTEPIADERNVICGDGYRLTVLSDTLLRVETQKDGIFTDEATQYVWNRNFDAVDFDVKNDGKLCKIVTEKTTFVFDVKKKKVVRIGFSDGRTVSATNRGNLGGTCRTLDMRVGKVALGNGVLSKNGVAVIRDDGLVLCDDGVVRERKAKEKDEYIFAAGKDYRKALDDYFYLTGKTQMLPRYVLGNWWSRYYAYKQDEYINLMNRFEKENIPITVATVDMDWHWVNVNKKFGTHYTSKNPFQPEGWTGYSWNTDLFPDYKAFLSWLHKHNYHVTLNLHPASGIRSYEDCYADMARAMGIDPATKRDVPFDFSDNKFVNAYFDVVHRPYENDGVDFWWIDWQQGTKSTVKNVDPLWLLNHYHYLDNARNGNRGLVLSRFCGVGAQRYPLGFSGDYIVRWSSLNFQPEFTNRASNIGYDWWSHDIGGHNFGIYDDELYLRWCQYGVFSPINRLHSTCFALQGKEPWKHSETVRRITSDYLRLRHALIPYVYTASYRTHKDNVALCEPMYYRYPDEKEAYEVNNQYVFGGKLIVCPITERTDKRTKLACADVWLPEKARYTDVFTGTVYEGGKKIKMFRDLEYIPVLAKEGTIIPLSADEGNGCDNPENVKLLVFRGNGSYELYEDDGKTNEYENGAFATTEYTIEENGDTLTLKINPTKGDLRLVPGKRRYEICFKDVEDGKVYADGKELPLNNVVIETESAVGATVTVEKVEGKTNGDLFERANEIFSRVQGNNLLKQAKYLNIAKATTKEELIKAIKRSGFSKRAKEAALEYLQ